MQFLITGGGGYIGTTLIPYILRKGHSIRLIDKFFFGKKNIKKHRNLEIIDKYTINLEKENFKDVDILFQNITEAYKVLSNIESKTKYDYTISNYRFSKINFI